MSDTLDTPLDLYTSALWGLMDRLGVAASVERKVMAAVTLQFASTIVVFGLPLLFFSPAQLIELFPRAQIALTAVVFVAAVVAFANTVLIVRRDIITPVTEMESVADSIATGDLDEAPTAHDQADEIGALSAAFVRMYDYLHTASGQAEALGREDFDAAVLDEDLPGGFGDALDRMRTGLEDRITELEEQRGRLDRRKRDLEATADRYSAVLEQCAAGDMTVRMDTDTDSEAMLSVASAFNDMMAEWERVVAELQTFADTVLTAGTEVESSTAEMKRASEQISDSTQEITAGATEQSRMLRDVVGETNDLSATIQEIASSSEEVARRAQDAADVGEAGRDAAESASAEMDQLEAEMSASVERVERLDDTIAEIGEITDVISDIAEQTNLLALNAGIEAARADGAGDGFAVVAEEVKALAADTSDSAADIGSLIQEIRAESTATVEEIRTAERRVEAAAETVDRAIESFETVLDEVAETNDGVREIHDATSTQATSTQAVVSAVEDVAAISDQTAAETETVAAASEEQTASLTEVSRSATTLAERADALEARLSAFETDEGRAEPTGRQSPELALDGGDPVA